MSNFKASIIRGAIGSVLFLSGLYVGHIVTRRELEREFESAIASEVKELNDYFASKVEQRQNVINQVGNTHPSETTVEQQEQVSKIIRDNEYSIPIGPKGEPGVMVNDQPLSSSVSPEDLAARTKDKPYVISMTEYMEDEPYFDKLTLKYFEGDATLTDESDMFIDDPVGTVGEGNLSKFGYATSGDPDTVYIRNERTSVDYEIIRDSGKYEEVVLGIYDSENDRESKDDD